VRLAKCFFTNRVVAEGEGFEPPVRFPVHRFSRPTVSTTHTSLRGRVDVAISASLQQRRAGKVELQLPQFKLARMKFHNLGKVRNEIREAVVSGIEMILVFDPIFT
jgi:hypothetical protein